MRAERERGARPLAKVRIRFFARWLSLTEGDLRVVNERVLTLAAVLLASSSNDKPIMRARRVAQPNNFTGISPEALVSNNLITAYIDARTSPIAQGGQWFVQLSDNRGVNDEVQRQNMVAVISKFFE